MKKLSLLAVTLFLSLTAFSQAEVSIGIKAGPNFANINPEESAGANYESRTGFHGGAYVLFKLTKLAIQPELLFSQQGANVELATQDIEANFNYINIPVLFKLYLVGGLNLQIGPQFGFLAGGETKTTDKITGITTTEEAKDLAKGSDMSLALGAGWDLPFRLSIDARYNLGLTEASDESNVAFKNQVWQISLGLKLFKLGK